MTGLLLWSLQVVTALYLLAGMYVHIFVTPLTGSVLFDSLFISCAVLHGLNGMWGIIDESLRGQGWRIFARTRSLLTDFARNREAGHFMFLLHRITGLLVLLYLTQHLFTNSEVSSYLSIEDSMITGYLQNDLFAYCAVVSLGFHAFNGIRLVLIEVSGLTWYQRKMAYLSLLSGAFFGVYYVLQ